MVLSSAGLKDPIGVVVKARELCGMSRYAWLSQKYLEMTFESGGLQTTRCEET